MHKHIAIVFGALLIATPAFAQQVAPPVDPVTAEIEQLGAANAMLTTQLAIAKAQVEALQTQIAAMKKTDAK
jgi:hypothetical protein